MEKFSGKNSIVIGGTGGIGLEVARMLLHNGSRLVIHGRSQSKIQQVKFKLESEFDCRVDGVEFDFGRQPLEELENSPLIKCSENADILCVCFGPFLQKRVDEMNLADWQRISLLDYALPGFLTGICLKKMAERKWGRILLFGGTGTNSRCEFKTNAAYAGAKTAVGVVVQSVAAEYAKYGITCNAVLPGFVKTEYVSADKEKDLMERMPCKELISPKTIAAAAEFLLSDSVLNGVLLRVDQGWSPYA